MAISKKKKSQILEQYMAWLDESKALIITEYSGLTMNDFDDLRSKLREVGGEFHVVKNTIGTIALSEKGYDLTSTTLDGPIAIGFGFEDAPGTAKILSNFFQDYETVNIKSGFLGMNPLSADEIKALAELPPLPVMRATLLSTILAPASQLARIFAEPGRQVAAVLKAYSEAESADVAV